MTTVGALYIQHCWTKSLVNLLHVSWKEVYANSKILVLYLYHNCHILGV